jgi:hypothetical protein
LQPASHSVAGRGVPASLRLGESRAKWNGRAEEIRGIRGKYWADVKDRCGGGKIRRSMEVDRKRIQEGGRIGGVGGDLRVTAEWFLGVQGAVEQG